MGTLIVISSMAIIVAIVGCATIWRFDRLRAEEIAQDRERIEPAPRRQQLDTATAAELPSSS